MRTTYEIAQKRVKKKKDFLQHLTSYVTVGAFLFAINAATSFGDWWFYFPLLGWGIGLLIHYFSIFGIPGVVKYTEEWEAEAIQQEMERKESLFNTPMGEKEYRIARKKIKAKKGFFQHLGAYIAVGLFFLAMNVVTSFGDWWFHFPMLGWGIGLAIHYTTVFGIGGLGNHSEKWEERAIQEEMERLRRQKSNREPGTAEEAGLELKEFEKESVKQKKWDDSQLV